MYTKIKRESSEKETQKNLKTLLNIVNNSSCYRCFLSTSGQDLDFFRNLNCNMKLNSIQIYNFINFFKKNIQRGSII